MIEIIPTHVPRDAEDFAAGVERVREIAPAIHIDVDDGMFAQHLTWPYTASGTFGEVNLSALDGLFAEAHLMVQEPKDIGAAFARAGSTRIIGHIEGFADADEVRGALQTWRRAGAQEVGLGLLLQTPFEVIEPLVSLCDVVHMMSIATIGVQGIPYDSSAPARIKEFHRRFPDTLISVDGGVSEKNLVALVRAGATRFGVGAAISKAPDPKVAYENLKSLAENAIQ
jgi:ribulose-phosphate 3-epimerase